MLEISFEDLILSVFAFSLLMIGFLLLGRNSTNRQTRRRSKRDILTCDVCGHLYRDRSVERIVDCPQCGRQNQRGRDKSLG